MFMPDYPSQNRKDGLTPEEGVVMDHLTAAWAAFARLPEQHIMEREEFARAVHAAQGLLAVRSMRNHFGW